MKIEAGKYYKTRSGEVVGPMRTNAGNNIYPWQPYDGFAHIQGVYCQYNEDGTFFTDFSQSPLDLVCEVEGPLTTTAAVEKLPSSEPTPPTTACTCTSLLFGHGNDCPYPRSER